MADDDEWERIGVRVRLQVWLDFKRLVTQRGMKLQYALTEAIMLWLDKYRDTK